MKRLLCGVMLITLFLCACAREKPVTELGSIACGGHYKATVMITVHGNKADSKYKIRHFCSLPDKLRMETLEPEFLKTKTIVKNMSNWRIWHPLINEQILVENLMDADELILNGVIDKSFFKIESCTLGYEEYKNKKYLCAKRKLEHSNRYRKDVALYIDKSTRKPVFMVIYDSDGKTKIEIEYLEYDDNVDFQNEIFRLN